MMLDENILKECKKRGDMNFLYKITQIIAESDSISEGYTYCSDYTKEDFKKELKNINEEENYLTEAGLPIYELFLKKIKIKRKE